MLVSYTQGNRVIALIQPDMGEVVEVSKANLLPCQMGTWQAPSACPPGKPHLGEDYVRHSFDSDYGSSSDGILDDELCELVLLLPLCDAG